LRRIHKASYRERADKMPKKYLTVQEVSRLLGVTPLTIRNWDAKGKLVAYRNPLNNYRMYKVEDIEAVIRQIELSRERPRAKRIDILG
jgi:excisionase family DNA binding protein